MISHQELGLNNGLTQASKEFLSKARVIIIGCGAVGSETARLLVKYGVKDFVLVDFDIVEEHNIANGWFVSSDVGRLKTLTLANKLKHLGCKVESLNMVLTFENYEKLLRFIDDNSLLFDCVDNVDTKLLINDIALKHDLLLVHSAVSNNVAQAMVVVKGSCLRCLYNNKIGLSCDEGLILSTVSIASALQAWLGVRLLLGLKVEPLLYRFNISSLSLERIKVGVKNCPSCNGLFPALKQKRFVISRCPTKRGLRLLFKDRLDLKNFESLKNIGKGFRIVSRAGNMALVFEVWIDNKHLKVVAYRHGGLLLKNLYDFETAKKLGERVLELINGC